MNALEGLHDSDTGEPPKDSVSLKLITTLREVIEHLALAKKENDRLQAMFVVGTTQWRACETIDDHLHEAFSKLGE